MNYVKVSALIAGLSIATVSVPPVKALISTDFLNQKNQISSNTLQKEAQAKPHLLSSVSNTLFSSNLKAEAVAQDNKLQFIQNTQSEAQPEVIKEQTGKLKIVNDTPFIAIVQLYQPNADEPDRYAYIPPCYQRSFLNTYSNLWQVSFNAQKKKPVGDVSDKIENTFVVKTSNLNQDTNRTCEYKPTAQDTASFDFGRAFAKLVDEFVIAVETNNVANNVGDVSSRGSRIIEKGWLHLNDSLAPGATINAEDGELQYLLRNPTKTKIPQLNKYLSKRDPNYREIDEKTYQEVSQNAETYYTLQSKVLALLDQSTHSKFQQTTSPLTQTQYGIDGRTNASIRGTSLFDNITTSSISKNDVVQVSSIIDFSKWYATSEYQSKPASGAYNVAALSN